MIPDRWQPAVIAALIIGGGGGGLLIASAGDQRPTTLVLLGMKIAGVALAIGVVAVLFIKPKE